MILLFLHYAISNYLKLTISILKRSNEDGFKGEDPDGWFNDDEIKKAMVAPMHAKDSSDPYFDSYSHYYIHEEMLKDKVSYSILVILDLN